MRAGILTDSEPGIKITVDDVTAPTPGHSDAIIDIDAVSLNYRDLAQVEKGRPDGEDVPLIPGSDVAGRITEIGPGVDGIQIGDRVVAFPLRTCRSCQYCREGPEHRCEKMAIADGGIAESIRVPSDRVVQVPDGVDARLAATLPIAYVTAWRMLKRGGLQPGERVFVPGATGGVGMAVIQLVDLLGGTVIGTSRSREKLQRLPDLNGLTPVYDNGEGFQESIEDLPQVDIAINHLGGRYTDIALAMTQRGGIVVTCGRTAGPESKIDVRELYWEHKTITGTSMGTQNDLQTLVDLVADQTLEPVIDTEFRLDELKAAFRTMKNRDSVGKLLICP